MASSRKTNHLTPINYGGSHAEELTDLLSISPHKENRNAKISFCVDGYTLPDPSGMELPTEQAAKRVAREIAKQISVDVEDESLKDVVVKTDDGKEIYKAPIR